MHKSKLNKRLSRYHDTETPLFDHALFLDTGGGGGATTSTSTNYTSSLPPYAEPYYTDLMGRAHAESLTPYQQYKGDMVAPLTPYQQMSNEMVAQMAAAGTPAAMQMAQQMSAHAAGDLSSYQYNPAKFSAMYAAPGTAWYQDVTPGAARYKDVTAGTARYKDVTAGQIDPLLDASKTGTVKRFMNPYMQAVVEQEKAGAMRDYDVAQQQRNAQAATAGAFGGSRQAVAEAEANRALMSQLQGIQATGLNDAYAQAMASLEAQRAAEMQRDQANVGFGLEADLANQQAAMGTSQFNVNAALEAQLANQQAAMGTSQFNANAALEAQLANQQAAMGTSQFNVNAALEAQLANQQANLEKQRLTESSRQFGASSELDAAGRMGALASDLAGMGSTEQQLAIERAQALSAAGMQEQDAYQRHLDASYNEFANARDYEQNMLNWYNQLLHGQPITPQGTTYQTAAAPSYASQLGGLGIAGLGLAQELAPQ